MKKLVLLIIFLCCGFAPPPDYLPQNIELPEAPKGFVEEFVMTRIFDEKFEDATDFDETGWNTVTGSGSGDPNADPADVSNPANWGDECGKIVVANDGTYTYNAIGAETITYWRVEFVVTAEGLANETGEPLILGYNNSVGVNIWALYLSKDASGNLVLILFFDHDGGGSD